LIARLSVVVVVCAIAISFLTFHIHKFNKHVKELKSQGQEVPCLAVFFSEV
jgi:ABC-type proline/glycine betaine transport system permease subunit